jgi:hypothetical protein
VTGWRVSSIGLVLAVAAADGAGGHSLAFYLLLASLPAAAIAALEAFGDALDGDDPVAGLQSVLGGLALGLVVLAAAARAPLQTENHIPVLAVFALAAALGALGTQALVGVAGGFRLERQRAGRVPG